MAKREPETNQTLSRGLEILRVLNLHNGMTVSQIARAVGLPRTSANRALDTLVRDGYVAREAGANQYRPTVMVKGLADGFRDEEWVSRIAAPVLEMLGKSLLWPLALSTPSSTGMLLRHCTDKDSPLALERFSPGMVLPLTTSASGRLYLAHCDEALRRELIHLTASQEIGRTYGQPYGIAPNLGKADADVGADAPFTDALAQQIVSQGCSVFQGEGERQSAIAVPIITRDGFKASLAVRFMSAAITMARAKSEMLPPLQNATERIRIALEKSRAVETPSRSLRRVQS